MSAITTSGLPDYQGMTLNDLKDGIRSENTKARSMARKSLEHVRTCGEMLIAMKGRVEHGSWICELKLIGIERKTASNYMSIAERWETVSHLNRGVKDALTLLCREDAPPAPAPSPRPSPASSKPPLPLGATYQDAEIVEPSAPDIEPEYEYDEAAIRLAAEHSVTPAEVVAAGEFHSATTRLSVLENKIEDGISKLKSEGMILPTVLSMLPHLTKSEIKSLIETLNTRWT